MAFAATDSVSGTGEARVWSVGPVKFQLMTWTAVSGDTTGTITADRLSRLMHVIVDGGIVFTAAPTYATNVATLAFAATPAAGGAGTVLCIGI